MKMTSTKIVKLQSRLRVSRKHFSGYKTVPRLTLSGVWLKDNGFNVGDSVEISISNRQLIIKNL